MTPIQIAKSLLPYITEVAKYNPINREWRWFSEFHQTIHGNGKCVEDWIHEFILECLVARAPDSEWGSHTYASKVQLSMERLIKKEMCK